MAEFLGSVDDHSRTRPREAALWGCTAIVMLSLIVPPRAEPTFGG